MHVCFSSQSNKAEEEGYGQKIITLKYQVIVQSLCSEGYIYSAGMLICMSMLGAPFAGILCYLRYHMSILQIPCANTVSSDQLRTCLLAGKYADNRCAESPCCLKYLRLKTIFWCSWMAKIFYMEYSNKYGEDSIMSY